ncbi:MAG: EamA family transporter [Spirochaetes bacterium]|nr:EamA family transporter [Spirochaetota bacterium]
MNWFTLSLSAALCWSTGSILVKKGFKNIPPLWSNIINNALTVIIYIPAAFIIGSGSGVLTFGSLLYIALASLLYQIFYYSISKGQISLTGTLVAGYPVITILLAHLFLGERLMTLQYLAIVLVLAGGISIAFPEKKAGKPAEGIRTPVLNGRAWVLWGILGAVFLGTGDFLAKFAIDRDGIFSYLILIVPVSNLFSGVNYAVDIKNRPLPEEMLKHIIPTLSGLILNLFGFVLLLLAFNTGKASLVAPVSSVYPAVTVLLAVRFLKEKITLTHILGIVLIILGLIMVGITAG